MPIIEVCNGLIFGTDGGVMGHQINQNISFLDIGHYEGLSYHIDCKLYKTVYQTESFSAQLIGFSGTPSPTIPDNPKLVSVSLSLSKDNFPNVQWQFRGFPLAGSCGSINLPELDPSISLGDCSFSIAENAGPFSKVDSVSFSETLDLITKELGAGGDGESSDSPLAKFGFVIGKQINQQMSISVSKKPDIYTEVVSVTATSADGGTSCHISGARINGIGETYAADNFAKFDITLSAEKPYQGI